jgi:NADH-quinone oxidoreductase subunit C
MSEELATISQTLMERFAARVEEFRGEVTIFLTAETLIPALKTLHTEFQMQMLVDITAVDYYPQESPRFHVIYQLYALDKNFLLRLRLPVEGAKPQLPTVTGIYPNASWYEREVYDLFGIRFEGHADMRRIIMPADWQGHPLRKDYPLGYEEVQYSFNYEEIQLRKPHPKE